MRSAPSRTVAGRATTNGARVVAERARAVSTDLRAAADDRGVTEVVGDIVGNLNSLARAEARLAVAELVGGVTERAKGAGVGAGIAAGGGLLAVLAIAGVLAAGAAALSLVVAAWLAILLVAFATGLVAWALTALGARHLRRALTRGKADTPTHGHASNGAKEHR